MVTKEQAFHECLNVVGEELSANCLVDKYFLCDENQMYTETHPQQMWKRLAKSNATAEKTDQQEHYSNLFYGLLADWKFMPAGRIMYGLGNPFVKVSLKNCYQFKIQEDSMKGIFDMGYWSAETYKTGGGSGINISALRPKGSVVHNAARFSSGAVNFMDFYSTITGMIGQMGRIGALLLSLDVSHPDIEDFIKIKGSDDLNKVRYANLSIQMTDKFMQAVSDNQPFDLEWGGKVYKTIPARQLWDLIIQYAWKRAEPGLLFWDAIIRDCPTTAYDVFRPVATNPCAESPGGHGDSCNLGSLNLGKYVIDPWSKACHFDYKSFTTDVCTATRFMDNIITLERSPLDFQQQMNDNGRRVGLGVMGLADVFLKFGIKYDSEEAREHTDEIMRTMRDTAYDESCNLAAEKGKAPAFDIDKHFISPFIQRLPKELKEKIKKTGIRNMELLSIAPTGSISSVAGCSSGCEPVFMMHYIRKTNLGTAKEVKVHEIWHSVAKEYAQKFNCKPDNLPDFFVNAHQVDNIKRIQLQATMQKYVCQAISNTFNLPREATQQQIGDLYMAAWRAGLKGITVYREGSREGVLTGVDQPKADEEIIVRKAPKRPESLDAVAHIIKPNGKTFIVFVGLLKGRVFEVFVLDHKIAGVSDGMTGRIYKESLPNNVRYYHFESGAMLIRKLNSYEDNEASLITRLVSTALRHGTPLEFLIDQMTKSKTIVTSMAKAIARTLALYVNQEEAKGTLKCDKCGSTNIRIGLACKTCNDCGSSTCS